MLQKIMSIQKQDIDVGSMLPQRYSEIFERVSHKQAHNEAH